MYVLSLGVKGSKKWIQPFCRSYLREELPLVNLPCVQQDDSCVVRGHLLRRPGHAGSDGLVRQLVQLLQTNCGFSVVDEGFKMVRRFYEALWKRNHQSNVLKLRGNTDVFNVTSVGQRSSPWTCHSVKVEIKFRLECKLHFPRTRIMLRQTHLANVSQSIEAKYWLSFFVKFWRLISANTSYCNRWLKIEATSRQTSVFPRCHLNPFTPKSDQLKISPAASPEYEVPLCTRF